MHVTYSENGMPTFDQIPMGDCFRHINGTALYIKCGDQRTIGTNAVNLSNGSKNRIDGDKDVIHYPMARVSSGGIK